MQDFDSLAVFKVTARDQGQYKGPSGAFVTHCNISCFIQELDLLSFAVGAIWKPSPLFLI